MRKILQVELRLQRSNLLVCAIDENTVDVVDNRRVINAAVVGHALESYYQPGPL